MRVWINASRPWLVQALDMNVNLPVRTIVSQSITGNNPDLPFSWSGNVWLVEKFLNLGAWFLVHFQQYEVNGTDTVSTFNRSWFKVLTRD